MCVHGYFRETDSCSHSNTPGRMLHSHFSTTDSSLSFSLRFTLPLSLIPAHLTILDDHEVVCQVENVLRMPIEAFKAARGDFSFFLSLWRQQFVFLFLSWQRHSSLEVREGGLLLEGRQCERGGRENEWENTFCINRKQGNKKVRLYGVIRNKVWNR